MAADNQVEIDLKLKVEALEKGLSEVKSKLEKGVSGLSSKISAGAKKLGEGLVNLGKKSVEKVVELGKKAVTTVAAGLTAATAAAVAFGKSAVTAFTEANEAAAQLNKMLQNTGNSVESVEHLMDTINEMSRGSVLGDSNLTAMAKQLATFDMSAEGIEQLLPALADMAVAEKGLNASMDDYVGIAQMMGKAVQGDVSGLSRMGFIIEDEVIEAIKTASTEEERLAMINEILGNTYADLAAEMKNSFAGQAQIAKNIFGKITEAFGGATAETYLKPLLEQFNQAFGEIDWGEIFDGGADGIVAGLTMVFDKAFEMLPDLIYTFIDYIDNIFRALADSFYNADTGAIIEAVTHLGVNIMNAFEGVFVGVAEFITQNEGFLTEGFYQILENATRIIQNFAPALSAAIGSLINIVMENSGTIAELVGTAIEAISDVLFDNLPNILAAIILVLSDVVMNLSTRLPDIIQSIVDAMVEFFVYVLPEQLPMIIKAAIMLFNGLVKGFVQAIPTIVEQIPILVEHIVSALVQCLPELISGFVELFIALVENLPTIIMALIDTAPRIVEALANGIVNAMPALKEGFKRIFDLIVASLPDWLKNLWYQVKTWAAVTTVKIALWLMNVWSDVKEWFSELPDRLAEWCDNLWTSFMEWLITVWDALRAWAFETKAKIAAFWETLKQNVADTIAAVVQFFSEMPGKIWTWLVDTYEKTVTWLTDTWEAMTTWINDTIEAVVQYFSEMPRKIWQWLVDAFNKTKQWLSDMYHKAKEGIKEVYDVIINKIKEIPGKMLEAGKNIVKGLWEGIKSAKDWLINKIKEFIDGVVQGAKDALGIHSPSRVFAQIGEFTAAGLGEGFSDQMSAVKRQIQADMRDLVASSQASTLSGMGLSGGTSYSQSNVFNFNVPTVSPYEIERAMRRAQYVR